MRWPGPGSRTGLRSFRAQHAELCERIRDFVAAHRTLAGEILDRTVLDFWVSSSHKFSSEQFSLNLIDPSPVDLEHTARQTCAQLLAAPLNRTCVDRDTNLALAITVFTILWLTPQHEWRSLMENQRPKQLLCLLLARLSRRSARRDDLSALSTEQEKQSREAERTAAKVQFLENLKRFLVQHQEAFKTPHEVQVAPPRDSKTGLPAQGKLDGVVATMQILENRLLEFQEEKSPGVMERLGDAAPDLSKTTCGIIARLLHLPAEGHVELNSIASAEDLAKFLKKSSAAFQDYQSIHLVASAHDKNTDLSPLFHATDARLTLTGTIEAMALLAFQFKRAVACRRSVALFACTFGLQSQVSASNYPCSQYIVPNAKVLGADVSTPGRFYKAVLRRASSNGQKARTCRAQYIARLFLEKFPWTPHPNTALTAISELAGDALERKYGACRIPELAHDIAGTELQPKFTDSIVAVKEVIRFTLYAAWFNLEPALRDIKADSSNKGQLLYQIGERYCCNHGLALEYISIFCGCNMPLYHGLLPRLDQSTQTAPAEHDFSGPAQKIWRFILGKMCQLSQSDGKRQENAACNAWKMLLITATLGARASPEPSSFVAGVLDRMQQEAADFLSNLARKSDRQEKEALPQISWTHFPLRGRQEGKGDAPPSAGNAFYDELYSQWLAAAGESSVAPRDLENLTEKLAKPLEATVRDVGKHKFVRAAAMIELLFLVPFWKAATFSQFPAHVQTAAADYKGGPVPLTRRLLRWKIDGVTRDEYFTLELLGDLLRTIRNMADP
jgi:hypothetical protein